MSNKINVNSSSPDDWLPSRPKRIVQLDDLHQELLGDDTVHVSGALPPYAVPAALAAVAAGGYYLYRRGQAPQEMSYPQQADDGSQDGYPPAMPNPMAAAPPDMGSFSVPPAGGAGAGAGDTGYFTPPAPPPPGAAAPPPAPVPQPVVPAAPPKVPVIKTTQPPTTRVPITGPVTHPAPSSIASVVQQVAAKIQATPQPTPVTTIPAISRIAATVSKPPAAPPAPAYAPKVPAPAPAAPNLFTAIQNSAKMVATPKPTGGTGGFAMHGDVPEQVVFMSGTASGAVAKGIEYGLAPVAWAVKETGNIFSFLGNSLSSIARKL